MVIDNLNCEFNSYIFKMKRRGSCKKGKLLVDVSKFNVKGEYVNMPSHLFPYKSIPVPLINYNWLRKIKKRRWKDEEESSDDDTPLSVVIQNLKGDIGETKVNSENDYCANDSSDKSECKTTNIPRINRPRGRPKKIQTQNSDVLYNLCKKLDISPEDNLFNDETSNTSIQSQDVNMDIHQTADVSPVPCGVEVESEVDTEEISVEDGVMKEDNVETEANTGSKNKQKYTKQNRVLINGKKMVFPCPECHKQFSAASTLRNHLKLHEGNLHTCETCGKAFITNYLLKCHRRLHSGDLFTCHTCGKGFITAELLKVHTRCHTGEKPFVCNICNIGFPSASNLQQHKNIHLLEKNFLCSECGVSFNQKRSLHNHMVAHSRKSHSCTVCGKLWARKSDLIEHTRVHTGSKPFECKICNQKFSQASSLRRHTITTHDDYNTTGANSSSTGAAATTIVCTICKKKFKSKIYYDRHLQNHSSVRVSGDNKNKNC